MLPKPTSSSAVWRLGLPLALFAVLWVDLVRQLSYTWDTNEQYAYGWFVPILALALFFRRWLSRPAPSEKQKAEIGKTEINFYFLLSICLLCLLLLPLRVVHEINPDWPLANWLLALLVVGLSFGAVFLAGGWRWVRYFAFPICFILVAVRWPYRIEHALTQNLMQIVASLTVEILGWFNIPAFQRGNLIEISTGVLGVDEACSGIRSFQSTLMASLFLGELYRLRWSIRLLLVGAGLTVAFLLNVCRTLLLTWQANAHGLSAIDKWHDPAGFTIAIACFGVLWLLAVLIKRTTESRKQKAETRNVVATPASTDVSLGSTFRAPRSAFRTYLLAVGLWSLVCIAATEVWYRSHEIKDLGVFHWSAALPESKPGFKEIELPPRSLKLLVCDLSSTGQWSEADGSEWTLYFFRWNPNSVQSIIQSRNHRPDVCLPAAGLRQVSESKLESFEAGDLKLPFRSYVYEAQGRTLYVFFCQWEDGAETQSGLQDSKQAGRLQSVLTGRRLLGQQTLEVIISGCDSLESARDKLRQELPMLINRSGAGQIP